MSTAHQEDVPPTEATLVAAVRAAPNDASAHRALGGLFLQQQRYAEALACFEKAILLRNDYVEAYNDFGITLIEMKKFGDALTFFDQAIRLSPLFVPAHGNRGFVLRKLGRFEAALSAYDKAMSLSPGHLDICLNRGSVLRELRRYEEAVANYRSIIDSNPAQFDAYCNLGVVLHEMGRLDEAVQVYDKAIALKPDFAEARWNKAITLLLAGDYEQGWSLYEWRWRRSPADAKKNDYGAPLWLGKEPLTGRTILLHGEQGMGDSIQFCRYVPMVAALGARVIVEVPRPLCTLMQSLDGVSGVVAKGDALPAFDCHCPMLSLPRAFDTRLDTVPAGIPYLHGDAGKVASWGGRIAMTRRPRVGLVWSGGFFPGKPGSWSANARRNILFADFARLNLPQVDFFSLQKGEPAESELARDKAQFWPDENFHNFAAEFSDFAETAALIENLDLVISVDTSTAHLAAALGKPVWLLNRYDSCWRWLLGREDSPWYPTLRLYRQQTPGDWQSVLERVCADLVSFAAGFQI